MFFEFTAGQNPKAILPTDIASGAQLTCRLSTGPDVELKTTSGTSLGFLRNAESWVILVSLGNAQWQVSAGNLDP